MRLTVEAADDWLRRYGAAWEQRSPQAVAPLFTEDCRYFETPFDAPAVGREGVRAYWQAVPDTQKDIEFRHRVLAVVGPTVLAHWQASFTRTTTGARVELDGMFELEFDDTGRCRTLREWWHRRESGAAAD